MNLKVHWLAAGSIVAAALGSFFLVVVTPNGLGSSSTGDLALSSTIWNWMSLPLLLAGTLALLSLESAHAIRRRPRHALVIDTAGRQPVDAGAR